MRARTSGRRGWCSTRCSPDGCPSREPRWGSCASGCCRRSQCCRCARATRRCHGRWRCCWPRRWRRSRPGAFPRRGSCGRRCASWGRASPVRAWRSRGREPASAGSWCCSAVSSRGLAGLVGRLDAEDVGELEAAFQQECAEVIQRHGGSVNLSLGGEVFACFGCPRVREDDSERAVRAALHLAQAVPEMLQRRLPHLSLSGLGARVGLHTDRMVLDRARIQGEAPGWCPGWRARPGPGRCSSARRRGSWCAGPSRRRRSAL